MHRVKQGVASVLATGALMTAMPASAIIVGGIDFGILGAAPFNSHIETTTIAATFAQSVGDLSTSYGLISTVNGDSTYCADGSSNCSLYFVATNKVKAVVGNQLYFENTAVSIYYSNAPALNLQTQSSAANLASFAPLTLWATLSGANGVDVSAAGLVSDTQVTQTLAGSGPGSIVVSGGGILNINLGDGLGIAAVEAFLNANLIPTALGGFADIIYTESASNRALNLFDVANGSAASCQTGTPVVGQWCLQGSADFRGDTVTVPEPGTLALLGMGLAAFGFSRRSRKA